MTMSFASRCVSLAHSPPGAAMAVLLVLLFAASFPVRGDVHTWTGAASGQWSEPGNWDGGAPTPEEPDVDLVFPTGAANQTNTNDIDGLTVRSLTFSGAGYAISGSQITLSQGINAVAAGTNALNLNIALSANLAVTVSDGTLNLGGILSGSNGLTKEDAGTARLTGGNSYSGTTTVNAGTLLVNGTQPSSNVTVKAAGTLRGMGTVGGITVTDGRVWPGETGDADIGTLTATSDVTFNSAAKFRVRLNGADVPASDRLDGSAATVDLGNSALERCVVGSHLGINTQVAIVLAGTLLSTFAEHPDDDIFCIGTTDGGVGRFHRINYSNIVTLTRILNIPCYDDCGF